MGSRVKGHGLIAGALLIGVCLTDAEPDGEAAWDLGTRPVFEQLPKKTSPGCTSAREFRVILLCPTVLFGAQMAATPSRPADV